MKLSVILFIITLCLLIVSIRNDLKRGEPED